MSARSHHALDEQIAQWRAYLRRRRAIDAPDLEELETHLRDQVGALTQAGLAEDEAFLVAVKRMGSLDALSREFAREHSERLWKQLVIGADDDAAPQTVSRAETLVVFALAVAAALAIKIPTLFGLEIGDNKDEAFYARNASLFVLPFLTGYFVWKRQMDPRHRAWLAVPFIVVGFGFTRALGAFKQLQRHYRAVERFGGVLLVTMGVLLLSGYLFILNIYAQHALSWAHLDWWTNL